MTVLLVDDDEDQLAVRGVLFRHSGFQTLETSDVPAAIDLARSQRPSCALIDLCLPTEQDGFRLIRELKEIDPAIPVFVLTGKATNVKDRPELQGVAGVFVKGAAIRDVISRLRNG